MLLNFPVEIFINVELGEKYTLLHIVSFFPPPSLRPFPEGNISLRLHYENYNQVRVLLMMVLPGMKGKDRPNNTFFFIVFSFSCSHFFSS